MCALAIAEFGVPASGRAAETAELFSEVIAKLLGVMSVAGSEEADEAATGKPHADKGLIDEPVPEHESDPDEAVSTAWTIDHDDPKKDSRVSWLLGEVGGRRALTHRYEDIRRQRWGRWNVNSYRAVQIASLRASEDSADDEEVLAPHADGSYSLHVNPEEPHHGEDIKRAWEGLVTMVEQQFTVHADVSRLVAVLAQEAEIQLAFGSEWPIRQIVQALNARHPVPPWSDDRVENAKKRLKQWIGRLARDHGLDTIDLMALFARSAREREALRRLNE